MLQMLDKKVKHKNCLILLHKLYSFGLWGSIKVKTLEPYMAIKDPNNELLVFVISFGVVN